MQSARFSDTGTDPLRDGIKKLWRSHELSDFTIRCGGREWPVHRFVLYFDLAVKSGFKESSNNVLELHEDDPEVVDLMLAFFYNRYYSADSLSHESPTYDSLSEAQTHARVFALAEKYLLAGLMEQAAFRFSVQMTNQWGSKGVARAIVDVYNMNSTASQTLRDCALATIRVHAKAMLDIDSEFSHHFRRALRVGPVDLAADVAELVAGQLDYGPSSRG